MSAYGQHDPDVEKRRLRLQAEVLEPLSERVLDRLGSLEGARILDVACGAMGLLRALSRRVGAAGRVVGTDVNDAMVASENLSVIALQFGLGRRKGSANRIIDKVQQKASLSVTERVEAAHTGDGVGPH